MDDMHQAENSAIKAPITGRNRRRGASDLAKLHKLFCGLSPGIMFVLD